MGVSLFGFDRSALNLTTGLTFAIGLLIASLVSLIAGLDTLIVAIAAFFTWPTDVPGPTRNRLMGMAVFSAIGVSFIWISATPR